MRRRRPLEPIPPDLLLRGYCNGIFPMADSLTGELGWYSADPRGILPLDRFHIPRRLKRELRKEPFEIRFDTAFAQVIAGCAAREESWISNVIRLSYQNLHEMGYAHSVEAWREGVLQGGLYGVAFRGAFFGESMFHRVPNASKAALIALVERLRNRNYRLLDIQMATSLTEQFGAELIPAAQYIEQLREALGVECEFN